MSSLTLFNSSGSMPFLALTAVFSFVISAIFMGIVTMWMILKQKISDELSARDIKINTSITAEITKIKNEINTKIADDLSLRDGSFTAEIERILNTKIANELSARLSEINSTFTVELDRINNDLNNKLNKEVNGVSAKLIPNLIVNSLQKSKFLRRVMLAMPQKRRKYWEDLITSRKPAIMILAELDP